MGGARRFLYGGAGPYNYSGGTTVLSGTLQGTTSTIQGNINDLGNVTFNQATPGTYSGVISNTGSVTITGGGTVTFAGANTYSGGTTIAALSTLQGTTNTIQGNILDNGTLLFNQTFDGTYAGNISGTGVVTLPNTNTGKVTFTEQILTPV